MFDRNLEDYLRKRAAYMSAWWSPALLTRAGQLPPIVSTRVKLPTGQVVRNAGDLEQELVHASARR